MNLRSIFIFSIVMLLAVGSLVAQRGRVDSLQVQSIESFDVSMDSETVDSLTPTLDETDSIPPKIFYPFLRQASVVFDYGKLLGYLTGVEKKNELGIQLNIKKQFLFSMEAGMSTLDPNDSYRNTQYEIKGSYFRVGAGVMNAIDAKNLFSLSVRYGKSSFEDTGTVRISSASGIFDPYEESFTRKSLSASWYEFILGSEKRIKPMNPDLPAKLAIGFNFRVRILIDYDSQEPIDVFAIPGYGRTFDKSVPAFNLYVRYIFWNND